MKSLLSILTVLFVCLGLTAKAQTVSPGTGTASVTSTIRVRIPDFASIMLKENTTSVRTARGSCVPETISMKSVLPEFSSQKRWIRHTERRHESKKTISDNGMRQLPSPALMLIHTATPE